MEPGEFFELLKTSTILSCLSYTDLVSNLTVIFCFCPGAMGCLGNSTLVHEHSALASVISKGSLPSFVKSYSSETISPFFTKPKFFLGSSNFSLACATVLAETPNISKMATKQKIPHVCGGFFEIFKVLFSISRRCRSRFNFPFNFDFYCSKFAIGSNCYVFFKTACTFSIVFYFNYAALTW